MSVFWTANFFLLIIEITKWPQCLIKYKIQDDPITEASGIIEKLKKKLFFYVCSFVTFVSKNMALKFQNKKEK